jgi:hypothetical protein
MISKNDFEIISTLGKTLNDLSQMNRLNIKGIKAINEYNKTNSEDDKWYW